MTDTAVRRPAARSVAWLRPRPTPTWWRDAVGLATWAGLVLAVALWVAHGGLAGLGSSTSEQLIGLGRLTGLVAADLLLVQVLLMARIPMVERSYGQDVLARRHRLVGFTSFTIMALHVVLTVLGYAAAARSGLLATTWDLVANYPGMLLATAGTGLLVMLVVTSLRAAQRRLRYESWHLLHLYAYLGVGLALPHQIWTGHDFTATPWARAYWWSLYAAAAGAVLVYRVALPLWRSLRHGLVVERVVREAPGVVSVHVRGRELHRLPVRAGQFFQWRFLQGPGWTQAHPFSLSAPPTSYALRLTAKDLGDGSGGLASLRPGTRVLVEGPYGRLTPEVHSGRKVTLVGAGVGITPLRSLLEDLDYGPGEAVLIQRSTAERDVLFRKELERIAARRGARVVHAVGRRVPGRDSWLPAGAAHLSDVAGLQHLVPDVAEHDVYVCGPDAWADAVVAAARGAGVPAQRIHRERFTW